MADTLFKGAWRELSARHLHLIISLPFFKKIYYSPFVMGDKVERESSIALKQWRVVLL